MERQQQLDDITAMNTSLQAGYNVAIHHLQNITQQSQIELAEQLKKNEDLSVELIAVENQKRAQFDAYQAELAPMEHFKKRYEEPRKGNEKIYKSDAPAGGDPAVCNKTAKQGPPAEIGATDEEPETGYTSDTSTLTRGLEALCHELDEDDFTLSEEDDSNNTVVRVESPDVLETEADKPSPQ
ncbi:GH11583 [Drosophila grimshawi]|uniref:GH11583 n=1 Tax=Drosophila grimshawi TaxID=7222 RepID=B4K0E9_DROGR|nr:GH11583 [Drosophila grimshawi]